MGTVSISAPTSGDFAVFFLGFMVASVLWSFLCAGLIAFVVRRAGMSWSRLTYRACAMAFLLLALSSLRNLWDSYAAPQEVQPTTIRHERWWGTGATDKNKTAQCTSVFP